MKNSQMPYIAPGREVLYVDLGNKFMNEAKIESEKSGCAKQSTGAVIVKDDKIIARGTNAGKKVEICPRVVKGSKTGEDYHFCKDICKQTGHAEESAVRNAEEQGCNTEGADLYLFGHWWCCKTCWDYMIRAGIKNVYLLKDADQYFKN